MSFEIVARIRRMAGMAKTTLSPEEAAELSKLESRIERGIEAWTATAGALSIIREKKLYRDQAPTFANYVETRWGISAARAYQLMAAAQVNSNVNHQLTEPQARTLAPLPPEAQRQVIAEVGADATLSVLEAAAARRRPRGNGKRKPKPLTIRTTAGTIIIKPKHGATHDQVYALAGERLQAQPPAKAA